ncbi:MAG: DUF4974 domain-containing protein [Prolixibacteraceae bacterium]|jgi:transmembrane sensor|nr:DUF4974 domain-containing protein [Prolixibacteraceae bacterium]MBT6764870.1 DUF4974 domain-containing protein [Prolixibacteraceae bacterium]MBT6997112.1 DUF4974 domain-containing protein [Prolixibacteraceae bacterium]MBT7393355.1 DUF4974 domain-containing protein [Prolixibacteraceae bacterium]
MNNYKDIIENPFFIKWIFNPTIELDLYWDSYIEEHPQEANMILELKLKLRNINLINNMLSEAEKLKLAYDISKRLDGVDKRITQKKRLNNFFKYAAVAILFFSVGASVVYFSIGKEDLVKYVSEIKIPPTVNGPMLILPEGKSIPLKNGESTLDYRNSGKIVLNEDSIVIAVELSIMNQLVMPHGSSSKVVLCDNTVVWLNAGSRLIYPSVFMNKTREVVLFGEAYFDVAKDNNKPFLVQTSALEIKVLGTQFNISAYPEDNVIQTVLKKGSVSIRQIGETKFENEIILKPNQLASFDKSTKLSKVTNVNTDFYVSWIDGLLSFENLDMNRVIKRLERYYDINIQFEDPMLGSIKISGKLDLKQNKEEVFEYLAKVSTTAFEKNDEKNYKIK